jgi:small subunit ribosomal protein S16
MIQIRLKRISSKKKLIYYIVVLQQYKTASKGFLEKIGSYTPHSDKLSNKYVFININRLSYWLTRGARMNSSVYTLIKDSFFKTY